MKIISHRGNINGPSPPMENKPKHIQQALDLGFDVEVDVWFVENKLFLGHNKPETMIDISFLRNNKLWCHAKNILALDLLISYEDIHCFYHQTDDVTLTSQNYIWTYPNQLIRSRSICVMPELHGVIPNNCYGVCTDYPIHYSTNPHAPIAS